jgi:predicted nucleotide-binding protein
VVELEDEAPSEVAEGGQIPEFAPAAAQDAERSRRVFVTHGKNQAFIGMIKKLLGFGELVPVVSVENQAVSKPVPDKVMDDMRSCGAAIIHVDYEEKLLDSNANEVTIVNGNVLIEIGAVMALYGRRFILLVREGVKLPSNLQGLYEVRYSSDDLSGETTIKLLEAINELKKQPVIPK